MLRHIHKRAPLILEFTADSTILQHVEGLNTFMAQVTGLNEKIQDVFPFKVFPPTAWLNFIIFTLRNKSFDFFFFINCSLMMINVVHVNK